MFHCVWPFFKEWNDKNYFADGGHKLDSKLVCLPKFFVDCKTGRIFATFVS